MCVEFLKCGGLGSILGISMQRGCVLNVLSVNLGRIAPRQVLRFHIDLFILVDRRLDSRMNSTLGPM